MISKWRNRLAWRIVTWVLWYIADETYRNYIAGAILYGAESSACDIRNGIDPLTLNLSRAKGTWQ